MAYFYALALNETGNVDAALAALAAACKGNPADRDILLALITIKRGAGNLSDAHSCAQALRLRYPEDPDAAALADELLQ